MMEMKWVSEKSLEKEKTITEFNYVYYINKIASGGYHYGDQRAINVDLCKYIRELELRLQKLEEKK